MGIRVFLSRTKLLLVPFSSVILRSIHLLFFLSLSLLLLLFLSLLVILLCNSSFW